MNKKDYTVIMYIAEEDKTMLSSFFYGIQQVSKYMIYENINICILHRSPELYGAYKIILKGDGEKCIVEMIRIDDSIDFHSADVLYDFVSESKKLYPAKEYIFLINCHSNGWYMKQGHNDERIKSYPRLFSKFEKDQGKQFDLDI